ncbi:hypothetical protein CLV93_103203 [Prolixibacter denitrificans]|uniref:Uncharacterized protein n=1 Tax=Prolixibacter denitrificans TaxID=1541063 RepID=A0A2P8CFN7_9BACT|nr:hypothetical protein CLV93_103203 [Prolixibacter denitrificans]
MKMEVDEENLQYGGQLRSYLHRLKPALMPETASEDIKKLPGGGPAVRS